MYKCKVCKRTYSVKNEYCECGSSEFEIIETRKPKETTLTPIQKTKEMLSWVILGICVICALIILFI